MREETDSRVAGTDGEYSFHPTDVAGENPEVDNDLHNHEY